MIRLTVAFFMLCLLLAGASHALYAQGDIVYPPELYAGTNVISIKLPTGIREIRATHTPNMTVEGAGLLSCVNEHELYVTVYTASQPVALELIIIDCRNRRHVQNMTLNTIWTVDYNRFSTAEAGETICRDFHIRSTSLEMLILDSITVNDPRVTLRLPGRLPTRIDSPDLYTYEVCFAADNPGIYKFPVTTWMRRRYPSGGYTTYPVADTGYVRVVPPSDLPPDTAGLVMDPVIEEPPLTDPTTFRTIVVPNAILPKRGSLYVGMYDLLGLTAGYAVDDHMMILAGGALPTPDDWGGMRGEIFGAYSIGVKLGIPLNDDLNIAGGYQWGRSFYDRASTPTADTFRSEITVQAPYLALSYGNDDSRISVTAGYALKHHKKPNTELDDDAMFMAIGGDTRIARHWKLAAEMVTMQKLGVVPLIGSVRYFGERYAIDAGIGYVGITTGDTKSPAIPLVPVISGIFVF